MAGDDRPHILYPKVALDAGQHQVTRLPRHAHDGTQAEQQDPVVEHSTVKMVDPIRATNTDVDT